MSAWIVSKKHVDLMVAGVTRGTRDGALAGRPMDEDTLGQILVTENVASVHYRYPDDDVTKGELPGPNAPYYLKPYRWEDPRYLPTAAELLKAVDCYSYQACEHPGWKTSAAKLICDRVEKAIHAACPEVVWLKQPIGSRLVWEAYEAAPWGFDDGAAHQEAVQQWSPRS